jgi:glycolate oxidase FAD binding subunit
VVVDGLTPKRVERPDTEAALAEALRRAVAAGEAVVPVGGGRALGLGDPPERFDVALETRALDRVLEMSPADMTCSVQAGITLEELNQELARVGQFLPVDPPASPGHTVGGVLAAALAGPLRLRYGSPRDFTIGVRVALPDGRLASSGGRVVKNVSGYDLNKLHQGALGTLGVIVAASFKVFPRPRHEVHLEVRPEDPWGEAERALRLTMAPTALELTSDGRVVARLSGTADGVARMQRELGWAEVADDAWSHDLPAAGGPESWARISVPVAGLREVVAGLPADARWWAWPGVGVAHWVGELDAEALRAAREAAERAGGSLVLMAAPVELKRRVGAWGTAPATLGWMRRLREAFDPARALNPGRSPV